MLQKRFAISGVKFLRRAKRKAGSGTRFGLERRALVTAVLGFISSVCLVTSFSRNVFSVEAESTLADEFATLIAREQEEAFAENIALSLAEQAERAVAKAQTAMGEALVYQPAETPKDLVIKTSFKAPVLPKVQNSPLAKFRQTEQNAKTQGDVVRFISGIVAVSYPSIDNCGEIARHIVELSEEAGMDPFYIASVISIESGFKPHAKSSAGAQGLMQLLPSTAHEVSNKSFGGEVPVRLNDPWANLKLGINYLKKLEKRYRGDRALALAAYNWGYSNVDQALKRRNSIPRSVRRYSENILLSTANWKKHFSKASDSADKLILASNTQAES